MILIVEDESVSRRALSWLLNASGYCTEAVSSAEQAVETVEDGHVPDVALVDLDLPGMNGMDLIKYLAKHNPSVQSVLITAASRDKVERLQHERNVLFLRKPIDFRQLLLLIDERQTAN